MGTLSANRRWVRAARFVLYGIAVLAALLGCAALFLQDLLNTPRVRAEIQRILSEAVRGEVTWEELRLRILPLPHGYLRKARLEIPQVASASAEEARVSLRLLPLFRGRAEITSVSVTKPVIRISISPVPAEERKTPERGPATDIFGHYRSVMGPVVDVVREYAPDTVVAIEDAELEVRIPGTLPMRLSKLSLRVITGAAGMRLDATAASPYWSWLAISARVEYADLSAKASLSGANINPQAWLARYVGNVPVGVSMAQVRLSVEVGTDGRTSLVCGIDARTDSVGISLAGESVHIPDVGVKVSAKVGAEEIIVGVDDIRLGSSRLGSGELRFNSKDGALSAHSDYDLDVAQGMDYTRRLVPAPAREVLAWLHPVTGRAHGRVTFALGPPGWSVGVNVHKSDVAVHMRDLPDPVRLERGSVEIDRHGVKLDRVALSSHVGTVFLSRLHYSFRNDATTASASFDLDGARWLEIARRVLRQESRDAMAVIQTVSGRAQGNLTFAYGRGNWTLRGDVPKSDLSIGIEDLPGPIGIARWSVERSPAAIVFDRAAISLLDARVVASATFDEFERGMRVIGSVAEGSVGEKFLAWVWQFARLPPRFEPETPIRITAPRITRHRDGALDVQATAQFDAGPSVAVDLSSAAGVLDIRRATVKDGRSDAELALRAKGTSLEGRFAGSLSSASIAAVLKRAKMPSGIVAGDLRFTIDREHPERMTADGHLKGEGLDLASLTGQPLKIERFEIATDDTALHLSEATLDWAGQRAILKGDMTRGAKGPVIDAQLDSPGIDLDVLLPREEKTAADVRPKPAAGAKDAASRLWPLPVTGRVAVRSKFVQRGRHRVAPVVATLSLEERRAHLDLEQATICGISLPLVVEATPQAYSVSARISAQKQQLEQSVHCLTEERVLITGVYNLQADISAQGTLEELIKNLKGTVRADARDGNVRKFALLGNILSMASVSTLMEPGAPKLDDQGFPYRALIVSGRFEGGRFNIDEGAFQSDAVGLAANGWISTTDYSSRLTVLVAPFSRLDELVRKVPLFGYVVGGVFTSVPVGVSGDIRDPLVVPLGPVAVGSELLGIFERTLKLPVKLVAPLEGSRDPEAPPVGP